MKEKREPVSYFNNCTTVDDVPSYWLLKAMLSDQHEDNQVIRERYNGILEEIDGDEDGALDLLVGDMTAYATVQNKAPWKKSDSIDPDYQGIVLGIRFLDGEKAWKKAVFKHLKKWEKALDKYILFKEVENGGSLKVTFKGNTNKYVKSRKTVYVPGVKRGGTAARRKVLHEFGHALGLSHEHFNPGFDIIWKADQIIADHINANSAGNTVWTVGMVRHNITRRPSAAKTCPVGSDFDEESIMVYPVDPAWNQSDVKIRETSKLSDGDIACIRALYRVA